MQNCFVDYELTVDSLWMTVRSMQHTIAGTEEKYLRQADSSEAVGRK